MTEMTEKVLVAACKSNGGYAAPRLNDQLFLQCRGFVRIENLDEYINLKVLWLEQNAISELTGLDALQQLVSLFVHNNIITSLSSLATLRNLRVLNLSHNYLTTLDGLDRACPQLETLQASHNHIRTLGACASLWALQNTLSSVDISFNEIELGDGEMAPVDFFTRLPKVSVIYFHGNPACRALRGYRRWMVLRLPQLTYLDERPVFAEERRVVEAWGAGGDAAEAREREAIGNEKREHLQSCVRLLSDRMDANRLVRDRLTRQWEERREAERQWMRERRRSSRAEQDEAESKENDAREALSAAETEARRALNGEAAAQIEKAAAMELERSQREAADIVAAAVQKNKENEENDNDKKDDEDEDVALPCDEDMMREMEEEMRRVLGPLEGSRAANRTARKLEKAVNAVTLRLQAEQSREAVWERFAQWEERAKHPQSAEM